MESKVNAFMMVIFTIFLTICLSATLIKWMMWSLEVWMEVLK